MQDDIRRTVLFLVNGFGVDKRDIYDICNDTIIPNINKLASENIYTAINNTSTNYKNGYRIFSTSDKQLPGYRIINQDIIDNYDHHEKFKEIADKLVQKNKKLHVFCYLDNETTIDQTKNIIRNFKNRKVNNIFVHVIFRTLKDQNYKIIEKNINNIKLISAQYPDVKFGIFFGNELLDNVQQTKDLYQMLITEVGERWPDFVRKIDILKNKNTKPGSIKPFFITGGFKVEEEDSILILNYEYVDYSNFVEMLSNPKLYFSLSKLPLNVDVYSLFPMKTKQKIESIYENEISENYLVKYLDKINAKALVITKKEKLTFINNFLNGMQNVKSDRLDFMIIDDNLPIPNVVTNPNYQLIIFDYDIGEVNNIEELKNELHKADTMLGNVAHQCKLYDYSLFVSSLYGIEKEWKRDNNLVYIINYGIQVPLIIADRLIIKGKHVVNNGSNQYLLPTIIKNMKKDINVYTMISEKQQGLFGSFRL
jgi:bisphosphoglycerate-independent phosphoglycerate mutase (AlkP superfamily)